MNDKGDTFAVKTSVRYAKDMPTVKKTGVAANHNWVFDDARIAVNEACDGCYCIITSEQEMGAGHRSIPRTSGD